MNEEREYRVDIYSSKCGSAAPSSFAQYYVLADNEADAEEQAISLYLSEGNSEEDIASIIVS